jgi:outer membrane protein assembly factor BamE (lipoprotein component of BamABCDE complex)
MKMFACLVLAVLLTACGGKDFIRPQNGSLNLGTTTYDQIIMNHGEPLRTGNLTRNGIQLKTITYSYAVAVPFTTKLSSKAMVFVFDNDILVSYDYASSFDDEKESANYDDEKVNNIEQGDKKDKVISILGKPGGEAIYPAVGTKGDSIFRYSFIDTYRIPFVPTARITRKTLTISFDSNDSVVDIKSVETKPE